MKKRVLVVDDDENLRASLRQVLELEDYDVETAANGELALSVAVPFEPDVIVLDVMMPVLDGFECLKRLRESSELKDTPVVMLTARDESESFLNGRELGAESYLVKPFNLSDLIEVIENSIVEV